MRPLDPDTHAKVTEAISRAKKADRDIAEYLHSYGLLVTPEWTRRVRGEAIAMVAQRVEELPLSLLLGGKYLLGGHTTQDVIASVVTYIRQIEDMARG